MDKCLGKNEAQWLEAELRQIVELETQATLGTAVAQARIQESYKKIQARPWKLEVLGCMGYRVSVDRDVDSETLQKAKNTFIAAMARMDEAMWPHNLLKDRPEPLQSRVIRRLQFRKDESYFDFGRWHYNNNGVVNRVLRHKSFSSKALAQLPEVDKVRIEARDAEGTHSFYSGMSIGPFHRCGSLWSAKGGTSTSLHEYGHVLDFAMSKPLVRLFRFFSNRSSAWQDVHARAPMTSPYGATDPTEDFAESFSAFFLDPLFACYSPDKFAILGRYVRANKTIYGSELPYQNTVNCNSRRVKALLAHRQTWVSTLGNDCKNR